MSDLFDVANKIRRYADVQECVANAHARVVVGYLRNGESELVPYGVRHALEAEVNARDARATYFELMELALP